MSQADFVKQAADFLSRRKKIDARMIGSDLDLIQAGIVDSVLLVEMILFVEDYSRRSIDVENLDIKRFRSLDEIYRNYVEA